MTYQTLDAMIEDARFAPEIESRCGVRLSVYIKATGQPQFFLCGGEIPHETAQWNFEYIKTRQ